MCQLCLQDGYTLRHDGTGEIVHGTYAGYKKHKNRGVELCELCKEAKRIYERTGNTLRNHPLTEAALSLLR